MLEADTKSPQRWTRRPLFSPSQVLSAEQLNRAVESQRETTAMLMRALHGSGVIFGYAVTPGERRQAVRDGEGTGRPQQAQAEQACPTWLDITCGMALDRHGRLLHWPGGKLYFDSPELVGEKHCAGEYTLRVHFAERRLGKGGCGPCADHPDWAEEGVVFSLEKGCEKQDRRCPEHKECTSWDDFVCARTGSGSNKLPPAPDLATACADPGGLCRIECSDMHYDAHAGIAIACVTIENLAEKDCPERWGFGAVGETCEVRPYVHRTPLLYELIRGCQNDLARVESLSWQDWCVGFGAREFDDGPIGWKEFAEKFKTAGALTITFTKPISVKTVHRGSVFFTATRWEMEADYVFTRRIPANLEAVGAKGGYAREFRFVVFPDWLRNEVSSRSYLKGGGRIELTIRGQMLRDQCGNMLNAVPLAYHPVTPVQSQPGDEFTAIFRFGKAPKEREPRTARED